MNTGDIVRLKSVGPLMTVESVVWFEKFLGPEAIRRDTFVDSTLEKQ